MSSPLTIAEQAIAHGRGLKAELEAYVQLGRTVTIKVYGGEVDSVALAEPRGLGIRAVHGGKTGYAFTTDLSTAGIIRTVGEAREDLEAADSDPFAVLPAVPTRDYATLQGLWRPEVGSLSLARKTELALRAEAAALATPLVEAVEESVYSDEERRVAIASSRGVQAETEESYSFVYVAAHAGAGVDRQSGLGYSAARGPEGLDPEGAGSEAAEKAVALMGARPCKTGSYTVVLGREVAAGLVSAVAEAFSAEAVQRGRSVFADRVGQAVGSRQFTLLDDGLDPEGMGTSPFDGEGVPQQTTVLVDGGVLKSYLHDSRSA